MVSVYDGAHALARAIRGSEEYCEMTRLREIAMQDDTNRTLLTEYQRLQTKLQLSAMGGQSAMESEDMQRFQQLASLLYMNPDVQAYLLAEMRLQKMLGDVMRIVAEAGGMQLEQYLSE